MFADPRVHTSGLWKNSMFIPKIVISNKIRMSGGHGDAISNQWKTMGCSISISK